MTPTSAELKPLLPVGRVAARIVPLAGDGSARRFYRVYAEDATFVLCVGPDRAENDATVRLARYLNSRGVPVPLIHGYDARRGWILMQDVGDRSLFQAVKADGAPASVIALYRPVLGVLAQLQVEGGRGYDPALGQFPKPYGASVMVEEEGMYFAREFASELVGVEVPARFRDDVERLAEVGARAPAGYLLHRDFQSRNVHLIDTGPAVLDFQGCRFGPLAYDAAALILDPYVGLPPRVRDVLLGVYRAQLEQRGVEAGEFDRGWFAVGAFRLLQALGAFAKLGGRFGKPGFLEHAAKGLAHLLEHLGERGRAEFPALTRCVTAAARAWEELPGRAASTPNAKADPREPGRNTVSK